MFICIHLKNLLNYEEKVNPSCKWHDNFKNINNFNSTKIKIIIKINQEVCQNLGISIRYLIEKDLLFGINASGEKHMELILFIYLSKCTIWKLRNDIKFRRVKFGHFALLNRWR